MNSGTNAKVSMNEGIDRIAKILFSGDYVIEEQNEIIDRIVAQAIERRNDIVQDLSEKIDGLHREIDRVQSQIHSLPSLYIPMKKPELDPQMIRTR